MNLFIQKKIEKCLDHFKQDVAKLEKYIKFSKFIIILNFLTYTGMKTKN